MYPMFNIDLDEVLQQEKTHSHPWERFIKDAYTNRIKTAHNSINNPRYPTKKEKGTGKPIERVKFTVIGNRVTKEFIYCINLVKGLYTYRKDYFESPVIRGVTSVDWPHVWNDLKIQYGGLAYCLTSQVVVFLNDKIVGGEKELKEFIEKKYTYHLSLNYYYESVKQFSNFIKGSGRPTVFMHISINEKHIGTMIFMLYADVVPYTCENFLRLCKATKGGYSGTPVHRIVKDGWIQCGGFGLKGTNLDCENFIVPPDKRGVLCMANAGRHVDCSTQFFVLLQPSPWMLHKYVAFGQLIDGDTTLRKIENVETWYESPKQDINIYQAGILNIDCQDIMINRGAHEYIHGHIEDLFALGEAFWEEIIGRVFLEIQMRENALLEVLLEGEEEHVSNELHLHATARFMKKGTAPNMAKGQKSKSQDESKSTRHHDQQPPDSEHENNDFDVSEYQYEAEEYLYKEKHLISVKESESLIVKPEKPYYIPLTDVPYPGEVSSEYNLKKFLRGDYCLETDLETDKVEEGVYIHKVETFPAELLHLASKESSDASEYSVDSDQEAEIKQFLKYNTDSASFAGEVIRGISRAKHDGILLNPRKAAFTDDELRFKKLNWENHKLIDYKNRSVRIDPGSVAWAPPSKIIRRPTAYSRPGAFESGMDLHIQRRKRPVLFHVLDDEDEISAPTLKEFRRHSSQMNSMMLTSTKLEIASEDQVKHYRPYLTNETSSPKHQARSLESLKTSMRSVAFAKKRPSLSVEEYQLRNQQYQTTMQENN
ncbi:uncharacterized protein LOC133524268 [Cydia pomonella]|uniref:uncharacterized protein LOC133524268 n=1 Tax=Cydia pomonella TaxID=82600 RepID=UPI002ADD4720|nr:uncharacterized protein LOC133524268 [Cydia pomonella]